MLEDARSIQLFGANIYLYGLFISLGVIANLVCLWVLLKKKGKPSYLSLSFAAWLLPLSWLFARTFYVLINLGYFVNTIRRPSAMLAFWNGGYSMVGALMGALVASLCFTKVNKHSFGKWLDIAITPLGLFLMIARGAEVFTLNIGRGKAIEAGSWLEQSSLFAINDFEQLMPGSSANLAVFRYEAIGGLILFLLALGLFSSKKFSKKGESGDAALIVLSVFGLMQVVFESLRDDGHLLWGFVRLSQIVSIVFPLIALGIFSKRVIKRGNAIKAVIFSWAVALMGVGVGIYQEFQIDVTANLLKEYVVMIGAMTAVLCGVCWLWIKSTKQTASLL